MQITQNNSLNTSDTRESQPAVKATASTAATTSGKASAGAAFHGVAGEQDTATLSLAASLLSRALAGDDTKDNAQPVRVEQISRALANGTYSVDSHRLASKLIESMQQNAG